MDKRTCVVCDGELPSKQGVSKYCTSCAESHPCAAESCANMARRSRLYCETHRLRLKKYGTLERPSCAICGRTIDGRGFKYCDSDECRREVNRRKTAASRARRRSPEYRARQAEVTAAWRKANPEAWAKIARRRHLMGTYKITPEQYDELLAEQGGCCAVCGATEGDATGRSLHVDHDHSCCPGERSCGKCVRGLLCKRCNTMLGCADDDLDRLRSGIAYLEGKRNEV